VAPSTSSAGFSKIFFKNIQNKPSNIVHFHGATKPIRGAICLKTFMPAYNALTPIDFFSSMHRVFSTRLAARASSRDLVLGLAGDALAGFEYRAENGCETGSVACCGGCASCCTIRVAATAPEIFLIADFIRTAAPALTASLVAKIAAADGTTRHLDESSRMAVGTICPFIEADLCVIYPVRPLACRGHASFDKEACVSALSGQVCEVPVSVTHVEARALVQNAMQSALRDTGLAWGIYELNEALLVALADEACEAKWAAGEDPFAAALITEVSLEEMGETFDAIKALGT
jgi:Fe-S-cluster containining protein